MQSNSSLNEIINRFETEIQEVSGWLEEFKKPRFPKTSEELENPEPEIALASDNLAKTLIGFQIQSALIDEEQKEEERQMVKSYPERLKNNGDKDVTVKVSRGGEVTVKATYYCRRQGSAFKKSKGTYAGLLLPGIHDRCSPGLSSEVSMMATATGSFEEACDILSERGLQMNVKTLRKIAYRYAQRARAASESDSMEFTDSVAGRRVVVSVDGGRLRIRKNKRGPKSEKGRSYYHTDWREPVLLNIYVIDDNGNKERGFMPFIDGTLKGPDVIFMLLKYYLSKLGITQAEALLTVADGARWIWNRIGDLLCDLQITTKHVYELVDFYHAAEHQGKIASLCKSWKAEERQRQVKKYRKLLKKGKIEKVVNAIGVLCRGRNSKKLKREKNCFIRNKTRMAYADMRRLRLPSGSGAMESAVRRVVNLRMKGAGIFWCEKSAEAMLLLRSFYKARRWDMLKKFAFSCSAITT